MSSWEIGTWLACLILGPGALVVFLFFLRDARRITRELERGIVDKQIENRQIRRR